MKTRLTACWLLLSAFGFCAHAQSTVFTYQGRVTDNGTNFSGTGQFKFALVTSIRNTQATATAQTGAGHSITGYTVTFGGSGYTTPPMVTVTGTGTGATATATVSGGVVTAITPANGGSDYSGTTTVTIAPPSANFTSVTYWSNDGTSVAGSEPSAAVSVAVSSGLFTVVLGDTSQSNMAPIAASLFGQPNLQLQIWFNDGVNGSAALNPVQTLTPTPYAISAASANSASNLLGTLPGNGGGLTNLNAGNIASGTLADARLSGNVALLNSSPTFAGDLTLSGGAAYHRLTLSGGNSLGFLYGSYPAFGDGIHLGYNYYADASGTGHKIVAGGGTSRISVGYGSIALLTGLAGLTAPNSGLTIGAGAIDVAITGTGLGIGAPNPRATIELSGTIISGNPYGNVWNIGTDSNARFGFAPSSSYLDGVEVAYIDTSGVYHTSSDLRLKQDITSLESTLERLLKLRPVSYHFRDARTNPPLSLGLIAQEVEPLFPEVVGTQTNGMKDLAYSELVPVTIRAIQELNQRLEAQLKQKDAEIERLKQASDGLGQRVTELQLAVKALQEKK